MPELRLEEESHTYTLWGDGYEGMVIPSITQVIQKNNMYGYARTFSNEQKMSHGSKVHKHTEWYDKSLIDINDVYDITPEIKAYSSFRRELNFRPVLIEHKLHHPSYLYAGTLDRFGEITIGGKDLWAIVEIKTGVYHPAVELQLAAQKELIRNSIFGSRIDTCFALYLGGDGIYSLKEVQEHNKSWQIFLSALTVLRWKEMHKIGR